jgi:glycine cleavage system H protein
LPSPTDRRYTKEHEWVRLEGDLGTVGITDYAQDQLGDIVYLDLPSVGTQVKQLDKLGEIESVKVNDRPEVVNQSPYGEGWLVRVRLADAAEVGSLLTAAQYDELIAQAQET